MMGRHCCQSEMKYTDQITTSVAIASVFPRMLRDVPGASSLSSSTESFRRINWLLFRPCARGINILFFDSQALRIERLSGYGIWKIKEIIVTVLRRSGESRFCSVQLYTNCDCFALIVASGAFLHLFDL